MNGAVPGPALQAGPIDERIYDALNIANRGAQWSGVLGTVVHPVIIIPGSPGSGLESTDPLEETRVGQAFMGYTTRGAVVGQFSHVQLLNPAGSSVVIYLDQIVAWASAVDNAIELRRLDTALTLITTGVNLSLGAPAGLGEVRSSTNAALQGTQFGVVAIIPTAGLAYDAKPPTQFFRNPIRLTPGVGVAVASAVANAALRCGFTWREKSL